MSGYGKSPLMEDGERHDIPFRWRRLILVTRQQPLLDDRQRTEKAAVDKALQTSGGDARFTPQLHRGDWEKGGLKLDGGGGGAGG